MRLSAVYPRACGGTVAGLVDIGGAAGLSPRLRGNQLHESAVELFARGLSPRLRGNHPESNRIIRRRIGSIPAPAGEPWHPTAQPRNPGVYPRACGGTPLTPGYRQSNVDGLSPRLRGNPAYAGGTGHVRGSIPAPAGEPMMSATASWAKPVYPRACGGTSWYSRIICSSWGLSPRLRGNLLPCAAEPSWATAVYPRACGGTSGAVHPRPRTPSWVYPRACGGTLPDSVPPNVPAQGLSPRLRGNH